MKQKKLVIVSAVLLLSAACMFADSTLSIGPAFTNYLVRTKMEGTALSGQIQNIVGDSFGNLKDEKNNAAGFALDWHSGLFYLMAQMAFPGKTHSDIFKSDAKGIKNSAIILDTQLGLGFTFFKDSPFNLFVGGGAGLNTMYAKGKTTLPVVGEFEYAKLDFTVGAGANVLASFFLTKHLGIYAGIADTVYFLPIAAQKSFKFGGKEYKFDNNSDTKVKNLLANSLNVKAGLTIKF